MYNMPEFCGCCHNEFVPSPNLVRVSCWGCRLNFHQQCLRMSEPEERFFQMKKIWWCPPCSQARTLRGLRLEDPPEMGLDYYYAPASSPCRSVLLAAKAIGVELNLKPLDLMKGEHLKPEFIKINPQHNVPTLDDNGFAINERVYPFSSKPKLCRAIITYLAEKYGKNDSLYPKDVKQRALVNQRLYFDMGTLYQRFGDLYYPVMFGGAAMDEEKKKKLEEAYGFLDKFLEGGKWAAGDNYTLADIALAASVSTAEAVGFEVNKYPNVSKWLAKAKSSLPGYAEANGEGAQKFKGMFEHLTKKA